MEEREIAINGKQSATKRIPHVQITKDGYVVDEVTWREKVARTEHREHVKNLLAQTIVEKAIDIEVRGRGWLVNKR